MAFKVNGQLRLKEYRDGRPVFDLTPAPDSEPAPVVQPAAAPVRKAPPPVRPQPGPPKRPVSRPDFGASQPSDGPRRGPIRTPDGSEPLTGYFTAQFGDDTGDYVTVRIRRQGPNSDFKPGKLLVAYLYGRNNEGDYTNMADIDASGRCWLWPAYKDNQRFRQAIASVLGDQKAAGEAWARATERCWRCHILLSTPESLERLMGEDCWNKVYG